RHLGTRHLGTRRHLGTPRRPARAPRGRYCGGKRRGARGRALPRRSVLIVDQRPLTVEKGDRELLRSGEGHHVAVAELLVAHQVPDVEPFVDRVVAEGASAPHLVFPLLTGASRAPRPGALVPCRPGAPASTLALARAFAAS